MLAQKGVWQTPTLFAIAEILAIGTPRSEVSVGEMAYAGKQIRSMWAGNQGLVNPDAINALRTREAPRVEAAPDDLNRELSNAFFERITDLATGGGE